MYFLKVGGGDHTEHRSSTVWEEKAVVSSTMVTALSQNWTNIQALLQTVFMGYTRTSAYCQSHLCPLLLWELLSPEEIKMSSLQANVQKAEPHVHGNSKWERGSSSLACFLRSCPWKGKLARPLKIIRAVECQASLWTSLMQLLRGEFFT